MKHFMTHNQLANRPFKLDINLDDEQELNAYAKRYWFLKGRQLAKALGFKGKHSVTAAAGLTRYSLNKFKAIQARKEGKIAVAMDYERICDYQYEHCIQPYVECW